MAARKEWQGVIREQEKKDMIQTEGITALTEEADEREHRVGPVPTSGTLCLGR